MPGWTGLVPNGVDTACTIALGSAGTVRGWARQCQACACARRSGKKCGHTIRQALSRHIGMLIDVISGIVGIEICEHVRRGAIRGHRTFLIAQDLSIEFVDESVHGCV